MHILCNSTSTRISDYFKLFSQRLPKLAGRNWPKLAKNVSFFKFPDKWSLEECHQCKHYSVITCLTLNSTMNTFSEISHSAHICRNKDVKSPKMYQNVLKLATLILSHPRISQDILILTFLWVKCQLCGIQIFQILS